MSVPTYSSIAMDARPDRLDLRDREYRPSLRSLPASFPAKGDLEALLNCYVKNEMVLNQGAEGACTGFGLAATINYLIWRDSAVLEGDGVDAQNFCLDVKSLRVSERMLYQMARIYDEWDGEDYSGSSCRGAMKGWHRHGVCKKSIWDYDISGKFLPPVNESWATDALRNPLGAYYRIDRLSVTDMQAAIVEAGAIYCSAAVHEGWWIDGAKSLPNIKTSSKMTGGHAFCIIGYNREGFIVQNSWGQTWGFNGFAVMSYSDWLANGTDAWVVSRGVEINSVQAPRMFSNSALQDVISQSSGSSKMSVDDVFEYPYPKNFKAKPWSEDKAYSHALVISNNGRPKHTVIDAEDPDGSAWLICHDNLKEWMLESSSNRKIAVYAHGGLNSEESALNRVRIMAPYFKANGIYPIFVVWKSGLYETLKNIVQEALTGIFRKGAPQVDRSEGLGEWISDKTDRAIEAVARGVQAKSLWSEMKENAIYASDRAVPGFVQGRGGKPGAMVILAKSLEALSKEFNELELHVVGHSAGAILLGAWLKEITGRNLSIETATLFAPACSIKFANSTYKKAIEKGVLNKRSLFIHNMDDEREQADNTGKVYRKSLLYLVSRALEDVHKMPLLGLQSAWDVGSCDAKKTGGFHESQRAEIEKWSKFINGQNQPEPYGRKKSQVKVNALPDYIKLGHGSFDNDVDAITYTLKKIRGKDLAVKVINLRGY